MGFNEADWQRDGSGRFAAHTASLPHATLADDTAARRRARAEALTANGYVPPAVTVTGLDPRSNQQRERWWAEQFASSEYGHTDGDYPQMPDDWTPARTGGRALSGNRRTHRMNYELGGISLRMPSRTSVRDYAKNGGARTFDVPVSSRLQDGRTIEGWVRCTRGQDGTWDTQPLGYHEDDGEVVAEGVHAVLSGQSVRRTCATTGDLAARRAERRHAEPVRLSALRSSWMDKVGYQDGQEGTGMMVMTTKPYQRKDGQVTPGRTYGYSVGRDTFAAVKNAERPGEVFNAEVRGQAPRVSVTRCNRCGMYDTDGHRCSNAPQDRHEADGDRAVQRSYAARLASRLLGGRSS